MQIILAGITKLDHIGNTTPVAKLYDHEGKLLGRCIDTPNAVATALFYIKGVALSFSGYKTK